MLRRIGQTVLWQYSPDVPVETLCRHHRIARTVVRAACIAGVVMMSACVDAFLSAGWWQTISFVILIAAAAIAVPLMLPMVVCPFWAHEIEKTLTERGEPLPTDYPLEQDVGRYAMKMCFYAIALVLVVNLIK